MTDISLYLRSSEDKAGVSIGAPRGELQAYAKSNGSTVAAECDKVEVSGSPDESNRPGLRALLAVLVAIDRPWQRVLCLRYVAARARRDLVLVLARVRPAGRYCRVCKVAGRRLDRVR